MIWHHNPSLQAVGFAVIFAQLFLKERRQSRLAKPTLSVAAVQPGLEFAATLRCLRVIEDGLPLVSTGNRKGILAA